MTTLSDHKILSLKKECKYISSNDVIINCYGVTTVKTNRFVLMSAKNVANTVTLFGGSSRKYIPVPQLNFTL